MINHKITAEKRLLNQYKKSINLINYIKTLLAEADKLEDIFTQLINNRTIDLSTGKNLDIIGNLVGQERYYLNDKDYRLVIKMRIILNTSIIDRESLIYALKFIFGFDKTIELTEEHCKVIITVEGDAPDNIDFYLSEKLIPKPAGVEYVLNFDDGRVFGYDGQDPNIDTFGYGDVNDFNAGGAFRDDR